MSRQPLKFPLAIFFFSFIFALIFLFLSPLKAAEDHSKNEPTLEELAKTDAAKFYISKQYEESLAEFEKLEAEYPASIIIKRYIASLLDSLRQWEKAIAKLQEALRLKPDDLVARQMLGDLYIKTADLDKAAEEFQKILNGNPDAALAGHAKQKLAEIEHLKTMPQTEKGRQMAAQDFMKSPAAQAFAKGKYEEALQGFDQLLADYPEDILVRRFRAITLLRLGRPKEALEGFEEALKIAPENVAIHFYLGQAYLQIEKTKEARKEFQWVIAHDQANYRAQAERSVFLTLGKQKAPKPRPWSVNVSTAYEYDTNATYRSSDPGQRTAGDQNSGRYPLTLIGTYRFYEKGKWSFTADVLYTHTLYNDFPNLRTYTMGGGVSALYIFSILNRPAFINIRDGATNTLLRNKFYVWSHTLSPSLILIPHKRWRTTLSYRWGINTYNHKVNGNTREITSRDGYAHTISWTHTFYFNDKRNLYTTAGYDYERNDTKGKDYKKNAHGALLQLHSPLIEKVEGDFSFRFKDSNYFHYESAPPKRRDSLFTLTFSVSRPLGKYLTVTGTYTFDTTKSRNNAYEYLKHVFGIQLAYQY